MGERRANRCADGAAQVETTILERPGREERLFWAARSRMGTWATACAAPPAQLPIACDVLC
eukprot:15410605-Alexandrium_andersonii.AAC.1